MEENMIKRKLKQSLIGGVILAIVLFFQVPALLSQEHPADEIQRPAELPLLLAASNLYDGRMVLGKKDKLGLTPGQEEKIESLMLDYESFSIRNSAEIKIKEFQFVNYLQSKGFDVDRKEMERHVLEISKIKTDMIVKYIDYLLDVRILLTSRQLEILKQFMEQEKKSNSIPPGNKG
jgi:hypothetical protein